jgi:hypothetical protein
MKRRERLQATNNQRSLQTRSSEEAEEVRCDRKVELIIFLPLACFPAVFLSVDRPRKMVNGHHI